MLLRKNRRFGLVLAGLAAGVTGTLLGPSSLPRVHADDDDAENDVRDRPALVTERAQRSIEKGCAWLAKHQGRDGALNEQGGYGSGFPVAMTSLAGMAWLAHGDTPTKGKYARNVRAAVEFLLKCAKGREPKGFICSQGESMIHSHGFATMFLAECLGSEGEPELESRIKDVLKKAVDLTNKAQSPAGGWYYTPDRNAGDEGSTTVTQVQALRACRNAGLHVPSSIIKNAVKYIEKSQCSDGGIAYTAAMGGSGSCPAISAAAVAVLYDAGDYDSPMAKRCLKYCHSRVLPSDDGFGSGHYYYAHLYLSQANWQAGGKNWDDYYPKIRDVLCNRQESDGKWMGDGVGYVYGTAIATTILAIPYEHVPIYAR